MKRVVFALTMAIMLSAGPMWVWAQASDSADRLRLEQVRLLEFAEGAGLDEAQAVPLLRAFKAHRTEWTGLGEQRAQLLTALEAAVNSGGDPSAVLAEVRAVESRLCALAGSASESLGQGLNPVQQARLHLFLAAIDSPLPLDPDSQNPQDDHRSSQASAAPAAPAPPVAESEALVREVLAHWSEALKARNLDGIMEAYSERFHHDTYGGKEGLRGFIQESLELGYAEGIVVDFADARVTLNGDSAAIGPVDVSGVFGSISFEFTLEREEEAWRIVGFKAAGV